MPTVAQLRALLKARGLRTDGLKRELEARLAAAPPGAGRGTAIDDGGAIGAPGREGVEEDASDESEGGEEEQDQDSEQQGEGSDDGEELDIDALAAAAGAAMRARLVATGLKPRKKAARACATAEEAAGHAWSPDLRGVFGAPSGRRPSRQAPDADCAAGKNGVGDDPSVLAAVDDASNSKAERKRRRQAERAWHELPEQTLTPALKRELRLLKLRSAADPKRFYKRNDSTKLPTRFAVGTVIEGATEFYSARLTKKERKQTMAEELLADKRLRAYRKKRVLQQQAAAGGGGVRKKPRAQKRGSSKATGSAFKREQKRAAKAAKK